MAEGLLMSQKFQALPSTAGERLGSIKVLTVDSKEAESKVNA